MNKNLETTSTKSRGKLIKISLFEIDKVFTYTVIPNHLEWDKEAIEFYANLRNVTAIGYVYQRTDNRRSN